MVLASPSTSTVVGLTESAVGSQYIELPADTAFVESCGVNERFAAEVAFVPLQKNNGGLYIYEARLGSASAREVCRVTLPGEEELLPYGCSLASDGHLWICLYNKNLVVAVDVMTGVVEHSVEVPAPNDVAVDPQNEAVVYVAGGGFRETHCLTCADPTQGRVYRIHAGESGVRVVTTGALTLAGIEKVGDVVYVSQLYDVFAIRDDGSLAARRAVWRGDDDRTTPAVVWLADNLRPFDDRRLLVPAYRTLASVVSRCTLGCRLVATIGNLLLQCITCAVECDSCSEAFRDPEVLLDFSLLNTAEPLRFAIFDTPTRAATHYELDLDVAKQREPTTKGREYFFDANVTHISKLKTSLICVNFQVGTSSTVSRRVLRVPPVAATAPPRPPRGALRGLSRSSARSDRDNEPCLVSSSSSFGSRTCSSWLKKPRVPRLGSRTTCNSRLSTAVCPRRGDTRSAAFSAAELPCVPLAVNPRC